jgi:hypothetical protein
VPRQQTKFVAKINISSLIRGSFPISSALLFIHESECSSEERIRTGLHVALQRHANAEYKGEIHGHDDPVDARHAHLVRSPNFDDEVGWRFYFSAIRGLRV